MISSLRSQTAPRLTSNLVGDVSSASLTSVTYSTVSSPSPISTPIHPSTSSTFKPPEVSLEESVMPTSSVKESNDTQHLAVSSSNSVTLTPAVDLVSPLKQSSHQRRRVLPDLKDMHRRTQDDDEKMKKNLLAMVSRSAEQRKKAEQHRSPPLHLEPPPEPSSSEMQTVSTDSLSININATSVQVPALVTVDNSHLSSSSDIEIRNVVPLSLEIEDNEAVAEAVHGKSSNESVQVESDSSQQSQMSLPVILGSDLKTQVRTDHEQTASLSDLNYADNSNLR